ncbi:MAG: hypothetical protein ABI765_00210 [Gemmatimonadota bacterium]
MNPILHDAANGVTLGWVSGITTGVFMICFLGWAWWAYNPRHRDALEAAARLPLDGGADQ